MKNAPARYTVATFFTLTETGMKPCWAQYALWATIIALGILTLLSGCGAKGDLYHPAPTQQKTTN